MATGAGSADTRALTEVRGYATQSTDAGDTATLGSVRAFASTGNTGVEDEKIVAYRGADVDAYASMGFLQGGVELEAVRHERGYPHILISYAYDKDRTFFQSKLGYDPPNWLGDSGAFTAWTIGEKVELADLIDWCRYHVARKPEFQCISLDVIPGEAGGNKRPTARERSRAMKESLANGDAMRAAGLKIIEVFHVFEPLSHLELLLDRRQEGELVALGGMVGRSEALKRSFADECFRFVRDRTGGWQGIPPLHGLGISIRSPIAARYPWWSVDSSSWIAAAQYGKKVTSVGTLYGKDDRTRHRSVRHLYLVRALEGWLKQEQALTKMWTERGVTFAA